MYGPHGWEFLRYLEDTFGGIVKLHGFAGVCSGGMWSTLALICVQAKQLLVNDTRILQYIGAKGQYTYEVQTGKIEQVFRTPVQLFDPDH